VRTNTTRRRASRRACCTHCQAARRRIAFEDLRRQLGNDDVQDDAHATDLLSGLLAGIAGFGRATTLVIDDAHRLPHATLRGTLHHLLHHDRRPTFTSRSVHARPLPMAGWDLVARRRMRGAIGTEDLRMTLPEATQWLRKRFRTARVAGRPGAVARGDLRLAARLAPGVGHARRGNGSGRGDRRALGPEGGYRAVFIRASCAGLPSPIADLLVRTAHRERLCRTCALP
jgi:hypothetical protein